MTDNSQNPKPALAPDEATVLDLFKTIFKDRRSFVDFVTAIFDVAKREQINRSLKIQQISIQEVEQARGSSIGSANFPWRSLSGLFLALLAQFMLEPPGTMLKLGTFLIEREGRNFTPAAGIYILAFSLILWGVQKQEWKLPALLPDRKGGDPATVRVTSFVLSILFSFIAFLAFIGNLFTLFNVTIWLLAILSFIHALWLSYHRSSQLLSKEARLEMLKRSLLLILVAACVIFFRVYRLGEVPSEPFSDHAEKILDIYDVTKGETHIFFTRNTGREGLQMYWTVLINWIFGTGLSFLSLKIGTVIFGLLTLPFVYLLGKEIGGNRVGLLALAFTGIGYWPNVISRVGLRFPLYPLFVAPTLFYLIRGLRTRNRNDFILSGLSLGLGLHGYSPIRILPFLVVVAIGLYLIHGQSIGARRDAVLWLAVLGFSALIVFLPLLRYTLDNPLVFSYRAFSRMGSIQQPLPGPGILVFFSNLWNALRMFNWDDGVIWVNSVAKRPALDVVSGALFLIGVVLVFIRYLRQRHWLDLFLLLSIPFLQLPSILSLAFPGENPALNRAGGAYVPAFLLVALALDGLLTALGSGKVRTGIAWVLGVFLLVLSGIQNYDLVFRQFSDQFTSHAWNSSDMGAQIKDFRDTYGTTDTVWIVPFPHWVDTRLPGSWIGIPNQDFALWRDNLGSTVELHGPKMFLVKANLTEPAANDQETLDVLQRLYPQGTLELYQSDVVGHDFWVFFVPEK
jgi:heme/copper-type cytochrome/quinol oxidase subunit 4